MKNISTKLKAQIEDARKTTDALRAGKPGWSTTKHIIFWLVVVVVAVVVYAWVKVG
jgi:hypothetical protein